MDQGDGTAPRNETADKIVVRAIDVARKLGIPDAEMAVALLIGAYTLARNGVHADLWADTLEIGAKLCRADADRRRREH